MSDIPNPLQDKMPKVNVRRPSKLTRRSSAAERRIAKDAKATRPIDRRAHPRHDGPLTERWRRHRRRLLHHARPCMRASVCVTGRVGRVDGYGAEWAVSLPKQRCYSEHVFNLCVYVYEL